VQAKTPLRVGEAARDPRGGHSASQVVAGLAAALQMMRWQMLLLPGLALIAGAPGAGAAAEDGRVHTLPGDTAFPESIGVETEGRPPGASRQVGRP
jgi:hypothetical protein